MDHKITANKILPYEVQDLMHLVLDVESYHKFIPYCISSNVVHREDGKIIADLTVSFKGMSATYRSTISYDLLASKIEVMACGTAWFQSLRNIWCIKSIGSGSSQLEFSLAFSSDSLLFNTIIDKALDNIRDIIMRAFEQEAGRRYGTETYKY